MLANQRNNATADRAWLQVSSEHLSRAEAALDKAFVALADS